jgi:HD-GYP domain-containing protein (c-di-GMP phosphodiesterase class II)
LHPCIPIVRSHHERWDGTGYPDRLGGEEIPILARIVAVADAFDAMTSDRPYHPNKKGKTVDVAFAEVAKQAGRQFDPTVAAAFQTIRDQVLLAQHDLWPDPNAGEVTPVPAVNEVGSGEVLSFHAGGSYVEI